MLRVSDVPNGDGLWSVRDENNERVALFYDDGLAREMVKLFNDAKKQEADRMAVKLVIKDFVSALNTSK